MKRRVVLRADASKSIGYGHFIRSLALAEYLKDNFDCYFSSYNIDGIGGLMSEFQLSEVSKICSPLAIEGSEIEEFNNKFLRTIQKEDIIVLDNYYYSTDYQQAIRNKGCKLVCIDDVHDRHMVCDLLLTVCPLERKDFDLESYTKFCGGIKYALLRNPFFTACKPRNIKAKIDKIVIGMGGADAFNLTDKMINIVHSVLPHAMIDVIAGDIVNVSDESSKIATIYRKLSAKEIVELFDSTDLGIFPSSTICLEAFSRKLPVVAGYYVDNQKEFYDYGVKNNLFKPLGCLLDPHAQVASRLTKIFANGCFVPVVIDFKGSKNIIIDLFKSL